MESDDVPLPTQRSRCDLRYRAHPGTPSVPTNQDSPLARKPVAEDQLEPGTPDGPVTPRGPETTATTRPTAHMIRLIIDLDTSQPHPSIGSRSR